MAIGDDALALAREELAQVRAQAELEHRHQEAMLQALQRSYDAARAALADAEFRAETAARALEDERQALASVRASEARAHRRAEALEEELRRLATAYDDLKFLKGSK